jgi:Ca2+-binding EF-hand superfamily protein
LAYYRQYGGPALQVQSAPPRFNIVPRGDYRSYGQPRPPALDTVPGLGEALFALLDTNKDGKLSRDELAAAPALMKRDADEDDLLSFWELLPQALPLDNPGLPGISRVRQPRPADRSSVLTLLDKTSNRPADVELIVRLGKRALGDKPLEIVRPSDRDAPLALKETDTGAVLMVGKTQIEFRCNEGRPAIPPGLRQRYLHQFRAADTTGKGFLTPRDAEARGFFPAQFSLLDRDGDGKLTERELLAYLDEVQQRQARALTSTVIVLLSGEGHGLFDLLDRNRDGRLSLRELKGAVDLPARLGRKPGEDLTAADLPRSYVVAIGLGGASFDKFGGRGTFSPQAMPLLVLDWTPPGLAWFFQMDRNHDGEVSWREFLGSREDFRRLDTDGDGVISIEEAIRAKR